MAQPRAASENWNRDRRSDTELLVDARRDPEAFAEFYSRNVRSMTRFFWRRTRDRDVASDLTAETFAAALARVERYNPANGDPRQWLHGIANNQLKRFWRTKRVSERARRRLEIRTPPTATTGWEELEAADARLDAGRLTEALSRVPAKAREAVRLRVVEQLDYSEMAQRLGCTPKAARDRVLRGLRRLRDEFDSPGAIEELP